jgi:hypothetical protein
MSFSIRSSVFEPGSQMSELYTCDDRGISPPLEWVDPPDGTRSFALICDDPDAPGGTWVHWVLYGLPGSTLSLPENLPSVQRLDDGSRQGQNDFGRIGYGGPCPPRGRKHRYFFRLFALDTELSLSSGLTHKALEQAMAGHVLGRAELMGTYGPR